MRTIGSMISLPDIFLNPQGPSGSCRASLQQKRHDSPPFAGNVPEITSISAT
jgi:hypothetical protein